MPPCQQPPDALVVVRSLLFAEDPPWPNNFDRFNRTTVNFGFIVAQNTSLTMRTLKVGADAIRSIVSFTLPVASSLVTGPGPKLPSEAPTAHWTLSSDRHSPAGALRLLPVTLPSQVDSCQLHSAARKVTFR